MVAAAKESKCRPAMSNSVSFGYESVPLEDKQELVDDVFSSVARRYDLMNDLMSGGLHRAWKGALVTALNPPRSGRPWRLIDVAGGTGDIALRVAERSRGHADIRVADINPEMLKIGEERAEKHSAAKIAFREANAETLPFDDASFDAYTIAFGIRNVPRIEVALSEAFRVLKHGGHFLCLEFSEVDTPMLDRLYEAYSFRVIPALGRAVAGDAESYRYLVESIRTFPNQERFSDMVRAAGFGRVKVRNFSGGIAALTSGWKI
jgi:demethylmenaquinone methyltransferase/2-methoxy-6-polyprenyl-1,4-benzoquinol methylase